MTATPYFDSYELRKKITAGSIWVCNKTKKRIQLNVVYDSYIDVRCLTSGMFGMVFKSVLCDRYTPLETEQ